MFKNNFILNKLHSGKTVLGTWIVVPSVVNVDIITSAGLDFVIIDKEHGPINYETAQEMVIACEANGASPILRVGDINAAAIQNALDIGVHGVQVPNIDFPDDARKVVSCAKYPPIGNRGFSPFTRSGNYSIDSSRGLMQQANSNTLVILNIEGKDAIDNLEDIMRIQAVDVLFVGLFDLSKALGIPGEVDSPILIETMKNVVEKAKKYGKYVGTISTNIRMLKYFDEIGVSYLVHLVDCEMLKSAYSNVVKALWED